MLAFLSDFGHKDTYAAQMELTARAALGPAVPIVHLCHDVPAFSTASGAWLLRTAADRLPPEAVVVAVVDPGVGTGRPIIWARLKGGAEIFATSPDLLAFLSLDGPALQLPYTAIQADASPTFHGRDVLTPAACDRIRQKALGGESVTPPWTPVTLSPPVFAQIEQTGASIFCQVAHVDHFGNLITPLFRDDLGEKTVKSLLVANQPVYNHFRTFAASQPGEAFWYWGSQNSLEVAINQASAAHRLGLGPGAPVRVELGDL